jgi:hypothetical protein
MVGALPARFQPVPLRVTVFQLAAPEASAWRLQKQQDDAAAAAAAAAAVRPSVEELLKNRTGLVDIAELKAIAAGASPHEAAAAATTPSVNWRAVQVRFPSHHFQHTVMIVLGEWFAGATAQEQRSVGRCHPPRQQHARCGAKTRRQRDQDWSRIPR